MLENTSIQKTKQSFEESFKLPAFYNKQTKDLQHLDLILEHLKVNDEMKILDFGTGLGFLAFPLAEKYTQTKVVGIDIVEETLIKNRINR